MGRVVEQPVDDTEMEALRKLLSGYKRARDEGLAPVNPALEEILSAGNSGELLKDQNIHVPGLTDNQDDLTYQEIIPEPFFFVKTCDMGGRKVFINMYGCSEVVAPGHWQNGVPPELEESFSLMESRAEDGMQNLRFSLSCADYILSTDKQGNLCKVYDVVFNLVVMRHSKVHKQLRNFLINMAMTWISQKYNIELKPDFKLPKGKYKGGVVRKHHIRAAKAQLVTEIIDEDAELQPSFPLLTDRGPQTLKSQGEEQLQQECICDKSMDVPRIALATQDSTTRIASDGTEGRATVSLHGEISKQNVNVVEDQDFHEPLSAPFESGRTCGSDSDLPLQGGEVQSTKKGNIDMEQGLCSSSSAASFEENKKTSQDITMRSAEFPAKRTPMIQVQYLGCPVELVIMCISFPSCLKLQDFQVWASNTKLYVEASSYEPIMVPLVFATTPIEAKATFFELESLLEVYLPFLTHVELLG